MQTKEAGITLVEILIGCSVLILVLSVGVPAARNIREDKRVDRVLEVVAKLESATRVHYEDTGRMAVEFSPTHNGEAYGAPRYHTLSIAQRAENWKGPYLARPLGLGDNPLGGPIYLQNNLSASPALGFRLDGESGKRSEGSGQFVVFYGVPEGIARVINDRFDRDVEDEDWKSNGRVEWISDGSGGLSVFLMARD